jgi:prophage tail gpP-like protein
MEDTEPLGERFMNPSDQIIEGEIAHLEQIVRMLSVAYRIDVKYWERRIEGLMVRVTVPSHRERLEHVAIEINRIRDNMPPEAG